MISSLVKKNTIRVTLELPIIFFIKGIPKHHIQPQMKIIFFLSLNQSPT